MRLIELFDKPMQIVPTKNPRKARAMTTTMEPSSTRLLSSSSSSEAWEGTASLVTRPVPTPHPEESFLHLMPNDLFPTYRPLPALVQSFVILLSLWASALSTWERLTFLHPIAILHGWRAAPPFWECVAFAAKVSLQEVFCAPSRISTQDLRRKYFLPSAISKYESLHVPDGNGSPTPVNVHYLKYSKKEGVQAPSLMDAVLVHHGFGASSLSWLPALPSLVHRLGARVGLGHDMVGFGFTDRQPELDWYTTDASARICQAVFLKEIPSDEKPHQSVALFGHSLGAIGAMKTALQLPRTTKKVIVLCAPALGLNTKFVEEKNIEESLPKGKSSSGPFRALAVAASSVLRNAIAYPLGGYVLRRVVGWNNSWKLGLKGAAWGNPEKVSDSDVLRYQWPSIGKGWERGLLQFARAQKSFDDRSLFRQVLDLPNSTVAIILGTNDKVIPTQITHRFLANFPDHGVNVVQLEGLGHNPFEEDVDTFINAVEKIISTEK